MNKLKKIFQCIKYRREILGIIGQNNVFRPGVMTTSAVVIGSNNFFSDRVMIGNAIIGNYCSFGPDVKIGQAQHSIEYITTFQGISKRNIDFSLLTNPVQIDSDVWIGANAVVMQGVHIGTGAVVGANAVVTHNVPPYAIVMGIPAKISRYRFSEEKIDFLLTSKWWEKPFDEASEIIKSLDEYLREGKIDDSF